MLFVLVSAVGSGRRREKRVEVRVSVADVLVADEGESEASLFGCFVGILGWRVGWRRHVVYRLGSIFRSVVKVKSCAYRTAAYLI